MEKGMNKAVNVHFVSVGEGVVTGRVGHVQSRTGTDWKKGLSRAPKSHPRMDGCPAYRCRVLCTALVTSPPC